MNPYKTREGGATVTVFVPYDCNNNCPFCVNKQEYADMSSFSLEKICDSIRKMDSITPKCDFVFTGGEPFANIESLQKMLDCIPETHRVFINTTLPVSKYQTEDDIVEFVEKNKHKITCINVSRHLKHYVKECPDEIFNLLEFRHRINCVVFEDAGLPDTKDKLIAVLDRFKGHEVQLRANYSYLTLDNVFETKGDALFKVISEIADYKYALEKERFRTGFVFERDGSTITYHKTLPFAKVDGVVGDIIVRQTGRIYDDWNEYGQELNANDLVDLQYK